MRTTVLLVAGLAALCATPAVADTDTPSLLESELGLLLAQDERRLPGQPPPPAESPAIAPGSDVEAVRPAPRDLPREFIPLPDRWRLVESLGVNEHWWDPYSQNTLKGDRPVFGQDWFFNMALISDTVYEPRTIPTPVGIQSTRRAGSLDVFGNIDQRFVNQNFVTSFSLTKGDTAFKPPDFELRLTPVFNINYTDIDEVGIVKADPTKGTTRTDGFVALQEAFVDYHLRDVSERYDFDSIRAGIQPFSTDFRGFLFQDDQLGVRLFGNRDNNLWQYNVAWFKRLEKDTNSGLNDITAPLRLDTVFLANLYRQDFPTLGMTSQATVVYNRNRERNRQLYDANEFLARPAPIGDERGHNYDVTYLGWNMDGHFGRLNLTGSFYYAIGNDDHSQLTGRPTDIRAQFLALEPSMDFDWLRVRLSGLYASGDGKDFNKKETGFDAIFENPQFAGADTSYWIRQSIPLIGGGGVALTGRNSVLPSLRTSKELGQSNFNNPGLILLGVGTDTDVLPELRLSTNFNYLRFADTTVLQELRQQGSIPRDIGYDLSAAVTYRPLFTQNVVFRVSGAVLLPGDGFRALYAAPNKISSLYSVLVNVVLTY